MTIPNIDNATDSELLELVNTFAELSRYAYAVRNERLYAEGGLAMQAAWAAERMEEIYSRLPEWARFKHRHYVGRGE